MTARAEPSRTMGRVIGGSRKRLVLMRHSKSSWTAEVDDRERPLSRRGGRDGRAAGRLLAERQIAPDLVLCSTAVRARETFDRTVSGGAVFGQVVYSDAVYEGCHETLASTLRGTDDGVETVLVVGHCPALGDLAEALTARRGDAAAWAALDEKFPTSAFAVIEFDGTWSAIEKGSGRLVAYAVPRA